MGNKPTILLTCAGGAGTLDLAAALQGRYAVVLADGNDQIAARYAGFPFEKIPFGSDPSFPAALRALAAKWRIAYVVPGADEELLPVSRLRDEGLFRAVMPAGTFVETCLHKGNLMHVLHERNISSLLPFASAEDVRYPAIVKPMFGRGSRAVHRVETPEQLEGYLRLYDKRFADVLVQPYAGGEEYTVSVIVNDRNALIGVVPKKVLEKRGITRAAVSVRSEPVDRVCRLIVEQLRPRGPCNVQLKLQGATCFVFEINPRLSTTAVLTEQAFGNEVDLCIRHAGLERISSPPALREGIVLYRSEAHSYVREGIPFHPNG